MAGRSCPAAPKGKSNPVMNVHVVEPADAIDQLQLLQDQRCAALCSCVARLGMMNAQGATSRAPGIGEARNCKPDISSKQHVGNWNNDCKSVGICGEPSEPLVACCEKPRVKHACVE